VINYSADSSIGAVLAFLGALGFFSLGADSSIGAADSTDGSFLYSGFGVKRVIILSNFAFREANWSLLLF
jgi:hypothetical protein